MEVISLVEGSVGFLEDPGVDVGSVVSFFSSFSSSSSLSSSSFSSFICSFHFFHFTSISSESIGGYFPQYLFTHSSKDSFHSGFSVQGVVIHSGFSSSVQRVAWENSGEAAGKETVPSSSTTSTSSCLSKEIERRSSLAMLARAPSRLEKLNWEPIGFFTTLMSLAELDCGGGGGGGGGGAAWTRVAGV